MEPPPPRFRILLLTCLLKAPHGSAAVLASLQSRFLGGVIEMAAETNTRITGLIRTDLPIPTALKQAIAMPVAIKAYATQIADEASFAPSDLLPAPKPECVDEWSLRLVTDPLTVRLAERLRASEVEGASYEDRIRKLEIDLKAAQDMTMKTALSFADHEAKRLKAVNHDHGQRLEEAEQRYTDAIERQREALLQVVAICKSREVAAIEEQRRLQRRLDELRANVTDLALWKQTAMASVEQAAARAASPAAAQPRAQP